MQWHWPEKYGEDNFVIMFGGLHIEMAALRSIGTLLQDSGWTGALVEAGITSSGTAESFLTASSITKTRQMHQITACSLYIQCTITTPMKSLKMKTCLTLKLGVRIENDKVPNFNSGI